MHGELLALNGVYANLYRLTFAQAEAAARSAVTRNAGSPAEVPVWD